MLPPSINNYKQLSGLGLQLASCRRLNVVSSLECRTTCRGRRESPSPIASRPSLTCDLQPPTPCSVSLPRAARPALQRPAPGSASSSAAGMARRSPVTAKNGLSAPRSAPFRTTSPADTTLCSSPAQPPRPASTPTSDHSPLWPPKPPLGPAGSQAERPSSPVGRRDGEVISTDLLHGPTNRGRQLGSFPGSIVLNGEQSK